MHVVHNAFRKGHEDEELVLDLVNYLKAAPGCKEDNFDTQLGLQLDEETLLLSTHSHESTSIWQAVQSLQRGLSTNPGGTMWCVCGRS